MNKTINNNMSMSMSKNARRLIVEDDPLLSESLGIILSVKGGMTIVGTISDGHEALEMLKRAEADIALVDLKMEGMGGAVFIRRARETRPGIKTLVLTTFYDEKDIAGAIQNGTDGYILKGRGVETIIAAIENFMASRSVIYEKVMKRLSEYFTMNTAAATLPQAAAPATTPSPVPALSVSPSVSPTPSLSQCFGELTKRELEICSLILKGYSNEQMAKALFISEGTLKNHITSIYDKTGLRSRTKFMAHFIELRPAAQA